jgi:hypothetical protein
MKIVGVQRTGGSASPSSRNRDTSRSSTTATSPSRMSVPGRSFAIALAGSRKRCVWMTPSREISRTRSPSLYASILHPPSTFSS